MSPRTIRNIELGLIARPRLDTLRRIAEVLDIEPSGPPAGPTGMSRAPSDAPLTTADWFVGRANELDQLDLLLEAHQANAERPTVLRGTVTDTGRGQPPSSPPTPPS